MNLILCGLPASGKTSVGKRVAEKMGRPFIDTDHLIEAAHQATCRELFLLSGEEAFREMEKV